MVPAMLGPVRPAVIAASSGDSTAALVVRQKSCRWRTCSSRPQKGIGSSSTQPAIVAAIDSAARDCRKNGSATRNSSGVTFSEVARPSQSPARSGRRCTSAAAPIVTSAPTHRLSWPCDRFCAMQRWNSTPNTTHCHQRRPPNGRIVTASALVSSAVATPISAHHAQRAPSLPSASSSSTNGSAAHGG